MSTEINTRGMVRSKISGFPAGSDAECLSKSQITATGEALVNGFYGDNECPVIEDVVKAEIHPLQSEITIKLRETGVINLSGYLQEITLLLIIGNGQTININKLLKVGEPYNTFATVITFNGNSISFEAPIFVVAPMARYTFNIDGKEYTITVTVIF